MDSLINKRQLPPKHVHETKARGIVNVKVEVEKVDEKWRRGGEAGPCWSNAFITRFILIKLRGVEQKGQGKARVGVKEVKAAILKHRERARVKSINFILRLPGPR